MPEWGQVNMIELSAHDAGRAFLAVTKYKYDDFAPYIFRTDDYGKTWKLLTDGKNGIPERHFTRVVREDPDRRGLLYAGTEFGIYVSFDDGEHWQSFRTNMPVTPITDIQVHEKDLVVATQGRGFWILDERDRVAPDERCDRRRDYHLFAPRDVTLFSGGGTRGGGGQNAPRGAVVRYIVPERSRREDGDQDRDARCRGQRAQARCPARKRKNVLRTRSPRSSAAARAGANFPIEEGMNQWQWNGRLPDARHRRGRDHVGLTRRDRASRPGSTGCA